MKDFRVAALRAEFQQRMWVAAGVGAFLLLVLLGRLFWLQVWQHDHFLALAESNRISLIPGVPRRGGIFDRHGAMLAGNVWNYALEMVPARVADVDATLKSLGEVVAIGPRDLRRFQQLRQENRDFEPATIRLDLSEAEVARFVVNRYRFPGVELRAAAARSYSYGETFAHVLGYIGRINRNDKARLEADGRWNNYRGSLYIGKMGVEKHYERWLHGLSGFDYVEVDSGGRAMRTLAHVPSRAGHNLYLHLDAQMQQIAEAAFGDYRGALVALDPATGGVLALVSKPGFDPNLFVDGIDQDTWRELNESMDRPMVNRALRGVYPPGSTLKPFMAMEALELNYRKPDDAISDPGYFSLPGSSHRYRDWLQGGHGSVDMRKSIAQSCDTYYYRLANDMGIETMHDYLQRFGFGQRSEVDMDGELEGLLPNQAWKQKRFKQPWWPGETVIAGIGQGYVLATPMQLAVAAQALASGGRIYKPRLLRAWHDPEDGRMHYAAAEVAREVALRPENLAVVREGMMAVTQPGGTAVMAMAGAPYSVASKTGTAQVVGVAQGARYDAGRLSKYQRDHALYIAFAPADKPRIALAVMVENGGHGGSTAAPIARKVLDYWLLGKRSAAAPAEVLNTGGAD